MYKEVDVSNKKHEGLRSGLLPASVISPLIPTLFLSLIFLYSSVALLPQVGLLLGWSQQIQYSGLENSMHCIVHGIANSWT